MDDIAAQRKSDEHVANVALRGEARWHEPDNSMRTAMEKLQVLQSVKLWFGDVAAQAWTEGAITAVQEYGDEMREADLEFDRLWGKNMRTVSAWRAAHPGNDLVQPDMTVVLEWLLTHVETNTP
jgi:hypothetical protein